MDSLKAQADLQHTFNETEVCAHCARTRQATVEQGWPICWTRVARTRVDEVLGLELRELYQDNLVDWLPDTDRAFVEFAAPHTDEILRIVPFTYSAFGADAVRALRALTHTVAKIADDLSHQERPGGSPSGALKPGPTPLFESFLREHFSDWYAGNQHRVFHFVKTLDSSHCVVAHPCDLTDSYQLREHTISVQCAHAVNATNAVRSSVKKMLQNTLEQMTDGHILVVSEKEPPIYRVDAGAVTGKATVIIQAVPGGFAPRDLAERGIPVNKHFTSQHAYFERATPDLDFEEVKRACCDSFVDQKHSPACGNVNVFGLAPLKNEGQPEDLGDVADARTRALLASFKITSKEAREKAAAEVYNKAGDWPLGDAIKPLLPPFAALDHVKLMAHRARIARNNPPKPVDERPAEAIAAAFALPAPGAITVSDLRATPMPHMMEPSK